MSSPESKSPPPAGGPGLIRQIRGVLGELFGGGRVDADQQTTLEVLFALLGAMAQADSIVTSHETEFVNDLMDELGLSSHARSIAKDAFDRGRQKKVDSEAEARRLLARFGAKSTQVEQVYDAILRLAAADERLRPRERELLEGITQALGFDAHALTVRLKILGHG